MLRLSTVNVVMPIGSGISVAFNDWLKAKLKEQSEEGWSQGELARRTNRNPGTVSTWINGHRIPDQHSREAIAKAFAVPIEEVDRAAGYDPDEASQSLVEGIRAVAELRAEIRETTAYLHELERAGFALEGRQEELDLSFGADGQTPLDEWNQIGNRLTVVQQQAIIEMLRTFVES